MKLEDALFNWLQIKIVSDARPDDRAAEDTMMFFGKILEEDHNITGLTIVERKDTMIHICMEQDGEEQVKAFDREWAETLLKDINSNPKYNE